MDCYQNDLLNNKSIEEKKKVSWRTIIGVLVILALLIFSSLSLMIH